MRFRVWVASAGTLLVLLWLVTHTTILPTLAGYLIVPPLPPLPRPPGVPLDISIDFLANKSIVDVYTDADAAGNHFAAHGELNPCNPPFDRAKASDASVNGLSAATKDANRLLAEVLITGQQNLDSKKQEAETEEKRLRLYVQAILTMLLAAACLYLLVHKKTTPTQRAAATGVFGIALGYWFK